MSEPAPNPSDGELAVLLERRGETALVTLNRPEQRNAIDMPVRTALSAIIAEVRDDDAIRSVVLTGAGRAFCGGGDLRSLTDAKLGAGGSTTG